MAEVIRIRTKSGKYHRGGKEYHTVGELCPACVSTDRIREKGKLVERKNQKSGDTFLGCSRYPECRCTYPVITVKETREIDFNKAKLNCPTCHGSGVDTEGLYNPGEPCPCLCIFEENYFSTDE